MNIFQLVYTAMAIFQSVKFAQPRVYQHFIETSGLKPRILRFLSPSPILIEAYSLGDTYFSSTDDDQATSSVSGLLRPASAIPHHSSGFGGGRGGFSGGGGGTHPHLLTVSGGSSRDPSCSPSSRSSVEPSWYSINGFEPQNGQNWWRHQQNQSFVMSQVLGIHILLYLVVSFKVPHSIAWFFLSKLTWWRHQNQVVYETQHCQLF